MDQDKNQVDKQVNHKLSTELYDMYAPPGYGKILSIVKREPIAEKLFEKVFVSAYTNDKTFPMRSPLMSLIDLAHDKSNKTINALTIFSACCSGTTISISKKKIKE